LGKTSLMRRLTATLPVAVLLFAVSATGARPAAGQTTSVGSPAVVEGSVAMVVEDHFASGRAIKHYFLEHSGPYGRHDLKLTPHQARTVQPGMRVRVTGSLAGRVLTSDAADHAVVVLEAPAAAAATPLAVRKVLVLLVNITDPNLVTHSVSATCDGSSDTAAASTFGFATTAASVDGCYQDSSFGQLGVGGASYPGTDLDVQRVTIADTVTACNYTSWGSKADAAATNLASYQHRVYVIPADVNCGWAGLAYVNSCPSPYCQSWVKAYASQPCGYVDAIAHELGHNIGLMHASSDTNNDNSIDCEYCDDSDFMGYAEANLRPLNGPHKVQMGWVSGPGIVDASGGGQFTLSPLSEPNAPWPQVSTIIPSTGSPYYVSYRTASGYDAFLPGTYYSWGLVGEISIHRWPGGITNTLFVTSLTDGQTFTDAANGLTIVQNSHSASGVTFTVSIGRPSAPTNLTATAGNAQVALSWTASAGATGYNVKRANTSGGPYASVSSAVPGISYLDTLLANGKTYYYVVSAVSGVSESVDSAQVSATPNGLDLVETVVGNPPTVAMPGASFSATDTVKNQGVGAAGASATRYYLSADQQKSGGAVLLGGSRSVSSLAAGQSSSGSTTVTIPSSMALGTYYLLACADELNAVAETSETNNCRASAATVNVTRPDLVETAVSNPPGTAARGGSFRVTDTVKNQAKVTAGASATRYYLSQDRQKNSADVLLSGSRSVSSLSAGKSSGASVTVRIPTGTAPGTYYVLACADDLSAVTEIDETNNCLASTSRVVVH
jgi:hypothetical protein